jgi:hypothetical protein
MISNTTTDMSTTETSTLQLGEPKMTGMDRPLDSLHELISALRYKDVELDVVMRVPHQSGLSRDEYFSRMQTLFNRYGIRIPDFPSGLGASIARFTLEAPPTVVADVYEEFLQSMQEVQEMKIQLSVTLRARRVPQSPGPGVTAGRKARRSVPPKNAT